MAALTYFDLYADAFRRGVMTEGQLVSAVRLGRITLPQAYEIRDTGGRCGALWTPPAPEPTPTPDPTPSEPQAGAQPPAEGTASAAGEGTSAEPTTAG